MKKYTYLSKSRVSPPDYDFSIDYGLFLLLIFFAVRVDAFQILFHYFELEIS